MFKPFALAKLNTTSYIHTYILSLDARNSNDHNYNYKYELRII